MAEEEQQQPLLSTAATRQPDADDGDADQDPADPADPEALRPLPGALHHSAAAVLESRPFHWAILAFTVLDVLLVAAELVIEVEGGAACGGGGGGGGDDGEGGGGGSETSPVLAALRHASFAILLAFAVEIALKAFVFGATYFWRSPVHLFDALVVLASIVLDLSLRGVAETVSGLLILLRGWRIVRVVDGVVLIQKEEQEEELKALRAEVAQLKAEIVRLQGQQ
ncbi:hypothetical protein DFJ73DRAFT_220187 [Zopfochytrium polystomum]|nr:hypothetical protein DFJ73DRAFT_220187 [Zopfochytrium polystomum]